MILEMYRHERLGGLGTGHSVGSTASPEASKAKVRDFHHALKLFEEHQGYRQLEDEQGQPFQSLGAFASARIPFGLGYDPEVILHLQQETRDMLLNEKLQQLVAQATQQGQRTDLSKFES